MKIFKAINEVMKDLGAIAKGRKNTHQGYAFRGIEDFYNSIHPELAAKGIFIATQVVEKTTETHQKGDKTSFRVLMNVNHKFYAEDGSFVEVITAGEGIDTSDKATSKALSMAMKYAFIQTFSIPTQDMSDPERDSPSVDLTNPVENKPASAPKTVRSIEPVKAEPPKARQTLEDATGDDFKITFGVYKGKTVGGLGMATAKAYANHLVKESAKKKAQLPEAEAAFVKFMADKSAPS